MHRKQKEMGVGFSRQQEVGEIKITQHCIIILQLQDTAKVQQHSKNGWKLKGMGSRKFKPPQFQAIMFASNIINL